MNEQDNTTTRGGSTVDGGLRSGATLLAPSRVIVVPADFAPVLMVVIDTEEEFDWTAPQDRSATSVKAMRHINRAQEIFDRFGVRACYVVDYPVASKLDGYSPLADIHRDGRCDIGAHLHPWVNPPFEETVCLKNSFPGNLECALEEAKLRRLVEAIGGSFGERPTIYKAGRYGVGVNTAAVLARLNFLVDLSPTPAYDYSAIFGPNFAQHPNEPFRFGPSNDLLCLPCTGAFVGALEHMSSRLYPLAHLRLLATMKLPGVLARLRLLERMRLSPEGFSLDDMKRLTCSLLARGVRVFTLSFHSPSLLPGCTPYVRNERELAEFLSRISGFLSFFSGSVGGAFVSPLEVRLMLESMPEIEVGR